jgi:23S rRNA (uracil1939-C5)-methyltransferase
MSAASSITAVRIHGLTHDGAGVGRLPSGEVIFVAGALPGDEVRTQIVGRRRNVAIGHLLEVVVATPDRVAGQCDVVRCGGCALRNLAPAAQLLHKRARVVESLRRLGGIEPEEISAWAPGPWGYRCRTRMHLSDGRPGYHGQGSNEVVVPARCAVLDPRLQQAVDRFDGPPGLSGEIEFAVGDDGAAFCLWPRSPARPSTALWKGAIFAADPVAERLGDPRLTYPGTGLIFEPGVFVQAHPEANVHLVAHVLQRLAGADRVLELHAGIGNFTVPLARAGARVTAVEESPRAVALGRQNCAGLDVQVHGGDATAFLRAHDRRYDAALLDPPRGGAGQALRRLAALRIPCILYVSCDPATLARDVKGLDGYTARHLAVLDLFPQTTHVEAVLELCATHHRRAAE